MPRPDRDGRHDCCWGQTSPKGKARLERSTSRAGRDGDEPAQQKNGAAVPYLVDSGEAGEAVRKRGWR